MKPERIATETFWKETRGITTSKVGTSFMAMQYLADTKDAPIKSSKEELF